MKRCTYCCKLLPSNRFYNRPDTGKLKSRCKDCECLSSRARSYNITLEQAQELMDSTNCHCCGKILLNKRSTYIDHCHEKNEIRGILCMSCNSGIGFLGDNIEGVLRAVNYLTNNNQLKITKNG